MDAPSEITKRNWLHEYLDGAVRSNICTEIHCSTCGAKQFRQGLLDQVQIQTGIRVAGRLTTAEALALGEALGGVKAEFSDLAKAKEAIRCVLYDVWRVLPKVIFQEEFVPRLGNSWSGAVLHEMQEYEQRRQAARQRQAEYESPAAVGARREERGRLKQEQHAARLARKLERDRLRRSDQ